MQIRCQCCDHPMTSEDLLVDEEFCQECYAAYLEGKDDSEDTYE